MSRLGGAHVLPRSKGYSDALEESHSLSCAESAAATRRIVVDAHRYWLALRRVLAATRQQRQQRRRAKEHDYDVSFH
jgi:hypothetical protein